MPAFQLGKPLQFLALISLLLAGCDRATTAPKKDDADARPGINLPAEQARSLGIETQTLKAANYRTSITGYGVVVALDTIAQADADTLTASAAAAQSAAAAARARTLATGDEAAVSQEVAQAAESKAAADQAALLLAQRKADTAFGIHAPWQNKAQRAAIMARLSYGRTVLVRVTFPAGLDGIARPVDLRISRTANMAPSWPSNAVWNAPSDPAIPGRSFYALVDDSDLAQNEHVTANVAIGLAETGIIVPLSALVLSDGDAWVYVRNGNDHFLRTRIDTSKPLGDGYFVTHGAGIAAGQQVVTTGAGLLLSHEINPSADAGD